MTTIGVTLGGPVGGIRLLVYTIHTESAVLRSRTGTFPRESSGHAVDHGLGTEKWTRLALVHEKLKQLLGSCLRR